jgi:hypothetical protein
MRMVAAAALLAMFALGCTTSEPTTAPEAVPSAKVAAATAGFSWGSATPESQGMCGSVKQLGCTPSTTPSASSSSETTG